MRNPLNLQTLITRRNVDRDNRDYEPKRSGGYGHAITVSAVVLLALAIRWWFNFSAAHPNNYGAADASEYLRNAQALFNMHLPADFWRDAISVLRNQANAATIASVKQSLAPLKDFYISGPAFPFFLAASYMVSGHVDAANWGPPLLAQTLVSAFTCGLIALIGAHAFSRPTGYLAGLAAALYPAFIVNSGRLYSETFAAFLLSAVIYLTVRALVIEQSVGKALENSLLSGLTAACLQFTRSVMVIVSIALVPITFIQYGLRKGLVAVIALAIGFAAIAAPWLAFQKLAFGSASLVVDRVGHYNFFTGNNVDTLGWLSFPYSDYSGVEQKPIQTLAKEAIAKNPRRWFELLEDKPLRLFKFPWNDFRTPIGDVPFKVQVLFHQFLIALACIGATLGMVPASIRRAADFGYERPGKLPKDQTVAKLFLLLVLAVHLTYLFFITVPRYNLTAMPVLIILAAAGLTSVVRLLTARGGVVPAVSIVFATALLFAGSDLDITSAFATAFGVKATFWGFVFKQGLTALAILGLGVFVCMAISAAAPRTPFETRRHPSVKYATALTILLLIGTLPIAIVPANANGRWYEWKAPIEPAQPITQRIKLSNADWKAIGDRALYLMIDADGINTLRDGRLRINGQDQELSVLPSISLLEDFSRLQNTRGVTMREGEWIWSCMTESVPMRNADLRQWFLVPLQDVQRQGVLSVSFRGTGGTVYGAYATGDKSRHIPSINSCSWEKAFYGVENPDGLSDPRFETKVSASTFDDNTGDLSAEKGLQTGSYNIRLLAAPASSKSAPIFVLREPYQGSRDSALLHKFENTTISDQSFRTFEDSELPPYRAQDLWLVRVRGTAVRHGGGPCTLKLALKANGATAMPYSSPWTPTVSASNEPTNFDFLVPFEPSSVSGLKNFTLTASAGGTEHGVTEFSNVSMQILPTPVNPIAPGSTIY